MDPLSSPSAGKRGRLSHAHTAAIAAAQGSAGAARPTQAQRREIWKIRQVLNLQLVDLNELVTQARRDVCAEFDGHAVRWQIDDLPRVQGDRSMLQQVMTNLLSNAVKYSSQREQSQVEVWCEESAAAWIIYVKDNGVGFDPAYAQKLFGMFQRLHSERDFKGTGVGLATVRRIILKHGGQVFAESQEHSGATFRFTLPKEQ